MKSQKQDLFTQDCVKFQGWDRAICEAQNQIVAAQEKIERLKLSIKTFEEMRDKGEPFPCEEAAQKEEAA